MSGFREERKRKKRAKAATERRETRHCCWPSCRETVTRKPSDFKRPVWFCSRQHSGRFAMGSKAVKQMCVENALDQAFGIGE
jgi:ribosomal protein L37AE/L43A